MSFEGFVRLHLSGMLTILVSILMVWVLAGIMARFADPELRKAVYTVRNYIVALILSLGVIGLAYSAMSNQTPRAVIDRTEVNRQQDEHEQAVQQQQREAEAKRDKEKNR